VLDHSCSKMGFGGKMCIDGTLKFEEERDDNYYSADQKISIEADTILHRFSEINAVNTSLLKWDIPCLIISVQKNRKGHIKALHEQLTAMKELEGVKIILYVEHTVDANDLPVSLWRFCNNLDPKRDSILSQRPSYNNPAKSYSCMGFDGTIKTKELDDFYRDWPNIIVAADQTIASVDAKWYELGLGAFIPSPSLKFKGQMYGEEAVAG